MVKQYPYNMEVLTQGEAKYNEQTGRWDEETEVWKDYSICRDELSTEGSKITTMDGEVYEYKWVVYLPAGTEPIDPGVMVRIKDGDIVRAVARVMRFSKDHFHSRLWL